MPYEILNRMNAKTSFTRKQGKSSGGHSLHERLLGRRLILRDGADLFIVLGKK